MSSPDNPLIDAARGRDPKPYALALADEFDSGEWVAHTSQWREEAVAELRRQHARIAELEAELSSAITWLAQCRDAFSQPPQGTIEDGDWLDAVSSPSYVPAYVVRMVSKIEAQQASNPLSEKAIVEPADAVHYAASDPERIDCMAEVRQGERAPGIREKE